MRKTTRIKWQGIIQQQSDSGLPVSTFCKNSRLSITCFYKYKNELKIYDNPETKSSFVKIQQPKITNSSDAIKFQYHQSTLHLPATLEPAWIAKLLKALA